MKFSIYLVSSILLFLSINLFGQQKPSLIGLEQDGIHTSTYNSKNVNNNGSDTAILVSWPLNKKGQPSVAGIVRIKIINNRFVIERRSVSLGKSNVLEKLGDILIDDVPIPFERVGGGGNQGGGIPIDTAILIKWPPVKSGNKYTTLTSLVTGYIQNGDFTFVQQSKRLIPTTIGKLGDILINDVEIPFERRAFGGEPEKPKGCYCVEEPTPGTFTGVNVDCPGGDCVKCCADVKKQGGKRTPLPTEVALAISKGKYSGDWGDKKYYFNNVKPKQETTTLGEISAKWDKNKYPYGIVVFNNNSYGYDKAENIQEWLKNKKNLFGTVQSQIPVFVIPTEPIDTLEPQDANGAGTRAAVPSARGRPGLRNEVLIPPPSSQAFFPQIQYKNDVRLVKCYDQDGNEYYVNCPIDEGDCCNLAPLPFIDLTSPAEKKGPAGSGTKPKKETEDVILEGLIKRRTKGGFKVLPIDTVILIKWPPKKNGQLTVAGVTTGTFTNNVFVPNQTNIKLGSIDVNAKYGDILIDDVPIPFEKVSGGGNPGGGIPIDTAIMIKWPPVKSGNRFSTVSGSVTGYVQNGYFVLVKQSKNATPTVLGKLGDILINDVLIPDERRAPGTEPEKPKGCCCVEEPSPGNFTMVNIDCPGGDCVKCCADVKKEGVKSIQAPEDIVSAIKEGQVSGEVGGKKYYFKRKRLTVSDEALSRAKSSKTSYPKPKQETTTLGEISAKWDKDKYPYGIVVFNNSYYGYDKVENIQEWMKDNKNLKGKGEMPVPVFIIPITPKDTFPTIQAANGAGTRAAVPSARGRPGLRSETAPAPGKNETVNNNSQNGGQTKVDDGNSTSNSKKGAEVKTLGDLVSYRTIIGPDGITKIDTIIQAANGAGTRAAVPSARGRPGLRREVVIPPPNNTPFFPEIVYGENIRLVKCTDKDGNEYYVNCPEGTEYCCDLAPLPQIDLTTPAENNSSAGSGTANEIRVWNAVHTSKQKSENNGNTSFQATTFPPGDKPITFSGIELHGDLGLKTAGGGNTFNPVIIFQFKDAKTNQVINELAFDYDLNWSKQKWVDAFKKGGNTVPEGKELFTELIDIIKSSDQVKNGSTNFRILLSGDNSRTEIIAVPYFLENDELLFFANETGFMLNTLEIQKNRKIPARDRIIARRRRGF